MSLEIDVEKISEVLLADGWHKVSAVGDGRSSFGLEIYEFREAKLATQESPVPQTKEGQAQTASRSGARWTESDGSRVFCPVTSILAVKYAGQKKSE
jgi:hypothetical protein